MARNSRPLPRNTVAKKAVFFVADVVAYDADEPKERDRGERQHPERDDHCLSVCLVGQPDTAVAGRRADRHLYDCQSDGQEN